VKLPPFGRELASRLKFDNVPFHVVVTVGLDAWKRAKEWNACPNDVAALVLQDGANPTVYQWPVSKQLVVIDAACGPSDEQIRELAKVLLQQGAEAVTVVSRDGINAFMQYLPIRAEVAA
jgi:hypothetical protein